jgi:hypothetical protein
MGPQGIATSETAPPEPEIVTAPSRVPRANVAVNIRLVHRCQDLTRGVRPRLLNIYLGGDSTQGVTLGGGCTPGFTTRHCSIV